MSNLTDLVPPLELCRKIPAGEFADSAFVWINTALKGMTVYVNSKLVKDNLAEKYPAPTLQEIMAELTELQDAFRVEFEDGRTMWMVADSGYEDNAATAALKAYFREKGIEDGK